MNTSLSLPHCYLVVPHTQEGGIDEAVGEDGLIGRRYLVVDVCRLSWVNDPNASLLDGKGEEGAEGTGDDSGGNTTQEVGEEDSTECIRHGVELGQNAVYNSL